MDGGKQNFFKTRPSFQFKRKGGNKRGKWNSSSREPSSGNSQPGDTVYRILCPSRKIGGVIGKGGNIVKTLREATQAKITVADSVPGSDERVIIINSSPTRISSKQSTDEDSAENNEQVPMQLHCAAQDALLKVHDRIVEEDLFGGVTFDDDNDNNVVTARLLVPTNMVGCLLGKRGDVIQRLRSKTGASIRILPAELLPSCAMSTDELVQISGKPDVAKKALYEVSTLLHQNPRKDNPPPNFPLPYGGQGYPPPGTPMPNMLPPGNPMWPHRNSSSHGMPPITWTGGFGNQPSGFMPACINGGPTGRGGEASTEFSMKILCSAEKIGGVIGKGGFNVKQLQQETGAIIHVQDASPEADERVICVSAVEVLWSPRSQIIEAVLQLQNKTSEFSEKGGITTRLLVPSSKVGCILGQGGHVINEMRRRTQADIRVYSKEEKPKCAAEDEELVQISGNFGVAKDALAEIASRLRIRTLRDANAGAEHTPIGPAQGFGPARGLPSGPPLPRSVGFRGSNGYDPLEVGREYEPPSYPVPPAAPGYPNANCTLEGKIATNAVGPIIGLGGRSISNFGEVGGARVKLLDSQSDGSECAVEICSSQHLNAARSILQAFMASAGQNTNPHHGSYENMNSHQGSYHSVNTQQSPYQRNTQESSHEMNAHQSPYQLNPQQRAYTNISASQGAYHFGTQQGAYQY